MPGRIVIFLLTRYYKIMVWLLCVILFLLYIQALLTGFVAGYWYALRKTTMLQNAPQDVRQSPGAVTDKKLPQPEKHKPTSTVSKFPNPDVLRKKKDDDATQQYLADMRKKNRPAGSFVL